MDTHTHRTRRKTHSRHPAIGHRIHSEIADTDELRVFAWFLIRFRLCSDFQRDFRFLHEYFVPEAPPWLSLCAASLGRRCMACVHAPIHSSGKWSRADFKGSWKPSLISRVWWTDWIRRRGHKKHTAIDDRTRSELFDCSRNTFEFIFRSGFRLRERVK